MHDGEESFLQGTRDRAGLALADPDTVDGAEGSDFRRSPGKEDLVGNVEHFARDVLLAQGVAHLERQRHHRVARDPGLLLRFPGIIKKLVEYDFVIMDTPPAYVPEFLCGIYASQHVIVPAALHRWMISGFNLVKEEVDKSEKTTGIPIKLSIIPSCVTEKEAADVVQTTQWNSFKTAILRSASIRNAGNRGIPLKEQTKPWQQYQLFAEELEANQ